MSVCRRAAAIAAPLAALSAALLALPAGAQEPAAAWPSSRPVTILGGFPNGSGVDIYARRLAEPLGRALGVPVVVDNRSSPRLRLPYAPIPPPNRSAFRCGRGWPPTPRAGPTAPRHAAVRPVFQGEARVPAVRVEFERQRALELRGATGI